MFEHVWAVGTKTKTLNEMKFFLKIINYWTENKQKKLKS